MRLLAKSVIAVIVTGAATLLAQPAAPNAAYTTEIAVIKEQMRVDEQAVLQMQASARDDKDVIKLNCVNDKLVQMKPQMNIVDDLAATLPGVAAAEQGEHYARLQSEARKVTQLREEAGQCVDMQALTDDSSNSFAIEGDLTDPWDESNDFGGDFEVEAPGYASPDS